MAAAKVLSDERLRRRRVAAQLLHRPARRRPDEVVGELGGVQAQLLPAAALALRARSEGQTEREVRDARLVDRSIVLTWAMRGTLHLIPSDDIGWVTVPTCEPRIENADRRLRQEGVAEGDAKRAVGR